MVQNIKAEQIFILISLPSCLYLCR